MFKEQVPRDLYDSLLEKYDNLVAEMMLMKRDGFVAQPKYDMEVAEETYPLPDDVENAIHTLFEPGSADAARQRELAFGMLREMDEKDVIEAIVAGEDIGL